MPVKIDADISRRIFNSLKSGIMITDVQGRVIYMNEPYGKFLNLDPKAQIGRHCTKVVENTRMHIVARTGRSEINHIQEIKGESIVVQRIPIKKEGRVIAVFGQVMFSDLQEIATLAKKIGMLESKLKLYEVELLNMRSVKYTFDSILGESDSIKKLKDEALRATSNAYPVLVIGESGTGKELFAQAIHHSSARKIHPFVRINCAAIPKDLLESELFGYAGGAFTGAKSGGKPGKFELAHKGTIFLDEIGDMPLEMQPKLLRVLEEREFERVGGSKLIKSDFRVIAATNQNLEKKIKAGDFRSDLYYRLNVIPLQIPPLRERHRDVAVLAETLVKRLAKDAGIHDDVQISEPALNALGRYHWPGNVRELSNILERTLSKIRTDVINAEDLPFYILKTKTGSRASESLGTLRDVLGHAEKELIQKVLERNDYNKVETARHLGIHRTLLYRKIKKHDIALNP